MGSEVKQKKNIKHEQQNNRAGKSALLTVSKNLERRCQCEHDVNDEAPKANTQLWLFLYSLSHFSSFLSVKWFYLSQISLDDVIDKVNFNHQYWVWVMLVSWLSRFNGFFTFHYQLLFFCLFFTTVSRESQKCGKWSVVEHRSYLRHHKRQLFFLPFLHSSFFFFLLPQLID